MPIKGRKKKREQLALWRWENCKLCTWHLDFQGAVPLAGTQRWWSGRISLHLCSWAKWSIWWSPVGGLAQQLQSCRQRTRQEFAVKQGLKAEFSICWVIYILALTYCHKLWVVTERMGQLRVQRYRFKRRHLRWFGHLIRNPNRCLCL